MYSSRVLAPVLMAGQIMEFFEDLITKAYGVKSEDGRRFMKSEEISRSFMESPAYEVLFEELVTNDKAAADFVNAVMNIGNSAQFLQSQQTLRIKGEVRDAPNHNTIHGILGGGEARVCLHKRLRPCNWSILLFLFQNGNRDGISRF